MVEDLFESAIRQDINGVLKENGWNSFSDKTLLNMKKKSLIEIIRMLENNWCCSIERHKNTIAYAEDIKANCDLAIEGRDIKIDELEEKNSYMFDTIALQEQQIEKMKCCGNCKYGYCGGSSISIDKDGNRTFHNWNEEKQAYCDIGKNGKYQCWELEEND